MIKPIRSVLVAGLSSLLLFSCAPSSLYAAPIDDARSQLESIGQEYAELEATLNDAGCTLEETKSLIDENNAQIEQTKEDLKAARLQLSGRMSSDYKYGANNILQVIVGSSNFNELVSRVFYVNKIIDSDRAVIDEVTALQQELDNRQQELEDRLAEQEKLVNDTQAQLDALSANQQRAREVLNSLSAEEQKQIKEESQNNSAIAGAIESSQAATPEPVVPTPSAPDNGGNHNNPTPSPTPAPSPAPAPKPSLPSGSNQGSAVANALQFAGYPYVYGGASPADGGFDCSGLVMYSYQLMGINLPHSSSAQMSYFQAHGNWKTSIDQLSYGDVVFFPGHVGFYVGNGTIFHAPRPGKVLGYCPISAFTFLGGGSL